MKWSYLQVFAYRLLKSADIAEDKQQLATTTTSFLYDSIKKQLKAIYDSISQESIATPGKVEPTYTTQKMKFSSKDFFSKCDQTRSFLRIWSHLLKKSLIENSIFCTVL